MTSSEVFKYEDFFIRYDEGIGLFFYSCNNGLTYSLSYQVINDENKKKLLRKSEKGKIIENIINEIDFSKGRLLPTKDYWPGAPQEKLRNPITVNWLITKSCTHNCGYCYASDVIDNPEILETEDIEEVANNILDLKPLNVVISGGEPLLHKKIIEIVNYLSGKTGIIIDTNGFCFERLEELLPIILKNKIVVRVSLDSLRVSKEFKIRKPKNSRITRLENLENSFKSLTLLLSNNVSVTIQTVLTKMNANELESMGDKLSKMGINVWRIFEMQTSSKKKEKYKPYILNDIDDKVNRKTNYFINKVENKSKNYWEFEFCFTKANGDKNNVILVLPDGKFYTQAKHDIGKILIDSNNPYKPSREKLNLLGWGEHFDRYIG